MCIKDWNGSEYPLRIERRERPRMASLIEGFFTTTYNSLRRHMPEAMQETPKFSTGTNLQVVEL